MIMVSGPAARRLAKCKAELDLAVSKLDGSKMQDMVVNEAMAWMHAAASDVANELIAANHHLTEGDD